LYAEFYLTMKDVYHAAYSQPDYPDP